MPLLTELLTELTDLSTGYYRHGAPTELFKMVHGFNAHLLNVGALHEPSGHNETTASSPRPSPPVEEREKTTAVHGSDAHRVPVDVECACRK